MHYIITRFLIIFFIYLFSNIGGFSNNFSIEGKVYNDNGEILPGVHLKLNSDKFATSCNSKGQFLFEGLEKGQYYLTASYIGYETLTKIILLEEADINIIVNMTPSEYMLEEVHITGNQRQRARKTQSISVEMLDRDFFKDHRSGSLMQTISQLPGVSSMNVGTGVSKPIIRGLGFYRVLFAQNGIRQAGQHWSNHTGLSIDQHCVQQLEVIKGPASLRFGSDAIGGVVNVLPRTIPEKGEVSGEVSLIGKTNTQWVGTSAVVSARNNNFYFHANATYNNFGDFKIPDTDYFLEPSPVGAPEAGHKIEIDDYLLNTAGEEKAASVTAGMLRDNGNSYFNFSYHSGKSGFFDWMGMRNKEFRELHEENRREVRVPYQKVDNYSISHFTNRYFNDNKLEVSLGYQYNVSSEHALLSDRTGNRADDIKYYRSLDNLELELDLHSITGNILYSLRSYENHTIDFIVNSGYEINNIDGYSHIIPEYEKKSIGKAVIYKYNLSNQWIVNSGFRVDLHDFFMYESLNPDPAFGDSIFNQEFENLYVGTAGSLGFNYLPDENTIIRTNLGKSYRIPSAYELGAYGLHRHEGRFEHGDLDLKPEEAWQIDVGYERSFDNAKFAITPFVNYFTNYLFLNPSPELRPEGQVYEYKQSVALLYGGELSVEYTFFDKVRFRSGTEYVYALNLDLMRPLPFTPPFSSLNALSYMFDDLLIFTNSRICFESVFVGAQNNTVPNELKTPEYFSFNINLRTDIKLYSKPIKFRFKVRNVFDSNYYDHISFYRRLRIPEPGRDFQLFINIPF